MSIPRSAASGAEITLAAQCVRALLDRHGVARRKHSAVVTEVLNLSYSQGNRRLTTDATWALEELRLLAEHYGETLTELISLGQADNTMAATVTIGATTVPCRIVRGPAVHRPKNGALVAAMVDSVWQVLPAERNLATQAYDIRRLIIEPSSAVSRRIAVLDDHSDSAQTIAGYLEAAGFDPVKFTSLDQITAATTTDCFDGYVLDWILVKDGVRATVRDLVASIRSRDAHCPIIVLTGEVRTGIADEADIAAATATYRLKFFEKPARLSIISAALAGSLAGT
jgi:ActR/RegA family two-component response regulator